MAGVYSDGHFALIPEWVLFAEISGQAVRLYGVLARFADQRTHEATPSRRTLAGRMNVADPKAVDRALADLVRIGAVSITRRKTSTGDWDSNTYRIHLSPWGSGANATTPPPEQAADLRLVEGGSGANAAGVGAQTPPPSGANAPTVGAQTPQRVGAQTPQQERKPVERKPENETPPLPLGLPPEERRHSVAEEFAEFWAAYPKKVGKAAAERAWTKAIKRTDAAKILDVVRRYPWRTERQFVKDPATWLNAACWEDDLDAVAAANRPGRGSGARVPHEPSRDPDDYDVSRGLR